MSNKLINDEYVASLICFSRSWVRVQRFKRRHGKSHSFTVDPVMVGDSPRYYLRDVCAWIDTLSEGEG